MLLVGVCRKKLVLAGRGLVLIGLWDVAMAAGVAATVILGGIEFAAVGAAAFDCAATICDRCLCRACF